jgi:hypothetical protein
MRHEMTGTAFRLRLLVIVGLLLTGLIAAMQAAMRPFTG